MPRTRQRLAILLAVGVILALIAPAAQASELSIATERESVTYEEWIEVKGFLTGEPEPGGRVIELVASPYPYEKEILIRRGQTAESGRYSFYVRPDYNTRYFVRDAASGIESPQAFVWVLPRTEFLMRVPRPRLVQVKYRFFWSKELTSRLFDGRPVYWYFARHGSKYARRLKKTGRTRLLEPGHLLIRASLRIRGVSARARFGLYFCFDAPVYDAGVFQPGAGECPKRRKYLRPEERP